MKQQRKRSVWLLVSLLTLFSGFVSADIYAQCAAITGVSTTITHATCESNGQIVVNSSAASEPSTTYRIINGPVGYSTNVFTSNTIPSLEPGAYEIQISCGTYTATVNATVNDLYNAPVITAVASSCTGYAAGGTIQISSTGSATPLRYAVVQSDDPTITVPDASFMTLTGSINHSVAAYGQYQVKVKDACNNIITRSIEVKKTSVRAELELHGDVSYDCSNVILGYNLREYPMGNLINKVGSQYRLELWTSTTTTCPAIPPGMSSNMRIVNSDDLITLPIATKTVAYRITSLCGEVTTGCKTLSDYAFTATAKINRYCSGNIGSIAITHSGSLGTGGYTLNYTGYNAANVAVPGASGTIGPQSSAVFHFPGAGLSNTVTRFVYTFTDGCGRTTPATSVNVPSAASGAGIEGQQFGLWCTTVPGTGIVRLWLEGYVVGMGNVTPSRVKLMPVGGGAGYTPNEINQETWMMTFLNVLPGNYNLVIQGNSDGDCSTTIPVAVTGTGLSFSLSGTTTQLCDGIGSIAATASTNSGSPIIYTLKNSSGGVVSTNSSGNFVNITAGNYTVEASISTTCAQAPLVATQSFTITAAGANPVVVKKIGVVCEPTASGKAILELAGGGPFKIEMKLGSSPESAYTTLTTNAGNIFTKDALVANEIYHFRITDDCGKTTSTEVTILPLVAVNKLTTSSPCLGTPYTLAVENLPGATYSWTKDGVSLGITSSSHTLSSFAATDYGVYVCTVSFDGCVSRNVTYDLNSDNNCGGPLNVTFGPISALFKNGALLVNWSTLKEEHNSRFEVEISTDGTNFKRVGTVITKAENGNSDTVLEYSLSLKAGSAAALGISLIALLLVPAMRRKWYWTLIIASAGFLLFSAACNKNKDYWGQGGEQVFVRVAQIDVDGTKAYSKVVKVVQAD